ncbi:MAG: hypothetical protein KDA91_21530 [Planctomycetaceae bacterium]|nr:hypothetical protein [Planctomycetaceae bacterium]
MARFILLSLVVWLTVVEASNASSESQPSRTIASARECALNAPGVYRRILCRRLVRTSTSIGQMDESATTVDLAANPTERWELVMEIADQLRLENRIAEAETWIRDAFSKYSPNKLDSAFTLQQCFKNEDYWSAAMQELPASPANWSWEMRATVGDFEGVSLALGGKTVDGTTESFYRICMPYILDSNSRAIESLLCACVEASEHDRVLGYLAVRTDRRLGNRYVTPLTGLFRSSDSAQIVQNVNRNRRISDADQVDVAFHSALAAHAPGNETWTLLRYAALELQRECFSSAIRHLKFATARLQHEKLMEVKLHPMFADGQLALQKRTLALLWAETGDAQQALAAINELDAPENGFYTAFYCECVYSIGKLLRESTDDVYDRIDALKTTPCAKCCLLLGVIDTVAGRPRVDQWGDELAALQLLEILMLRLNRFHETPESSQLFGSDSRLAIYYSPAMQRSVLTKLVENRDYAGQLRLLLDGNPELTSGNSSFIIDELHTLPPAVFIALLHRLQTGGNNVDEMQARVERLTFSVDAGTRYVSLSLLAQMIEQGATTNAPLSVHLQDSNADIAFVARECLTVRESDQIESASLGERVLRESQNSSLRRAAAARVVEELETGAEIIDFLRQLENSRDYISVVEASRAVLKQNSRTLNSELGEILNSVENKCHSEFMHQSIAKLAAKYELSVSSPGQRDDKLCN